MPVNKQSFKTEVKVRQKTNNTPMKCNGDDKQETRTQKKVFTQKYRRKI